MTNSSRPTSPLFQPLSLGPLKLRNRMVMAPMTRSRADAEGRPTELVAQYYAQRAGAGLIVTEGVYPSAMGKGYVRTPGMHTDAQEQAWRQVTEAVHARGGAMFMQLMHTGRVAHPSLLPQGAQPVAPSAVRAAGQAWTDSGPQDLVLPRELTQTEVAEVVLEYGQAAARARAAGFDGVELHAASGYLPEQFLSSQTNLRRDGYGGTPLQRSRFIMEVLKAMLAGAGAGRVGIKISPEMNFNDIADATPVETYTTLVRQLATLPLAYLHVATFNPPTDYHALLRPLFPGPYLAGGGLTQERADALLAAGAIDAAVFGAPFVANPDLPERFLRGAALTAADRNTFYSPGAAGYTDYPALAA